MVVTAVGICDEETSRIYVSVPATRRWNTMGSGIVYVLGRKRSPPPARGSIVMAEDVNIVVMDGPGPFWFGRLLGPLMLIPAPHADAIAIEGQMEINETGRRAIVRLPLADANVLELWKLLDAYVRTKGLKRIRSSAATR
jgi:hypothetical protein